MNYFVIDIESSDFDRSRRSACVYCGDTTSLTRDHVVSVSWTGYKRSYDKGDIVPSCRECNSMLGDKPLFSISSRSAFIANRLEIKYRKVINHPHWHDYELELMSNEFQKTLKNRGNAKSFIEARIKHASLTSFDENSLVKIKQHKHEDNNKYRILSDLYGGNSYDNVSKIYEIPVIQLKSMFRNKGSNNILSLFKWEHGIPFDMSIYKIIQHVQNEKKLQDNKNATDDNDKTTDAIGKPRAKSTRKVVKLPPNCS